MARPPARIPHPAALEASGSPVPPALTVTISATLDYNGTPIPINSTIGKGLVFELTQPVTLGTIHDFLRWLQTEFSLPDLYDEVTALEGKIPQTPQFLHDLYNAFVLFLNSPISITTLIINTQTKTYALGVTMTIGGSPPGLHLFGGLSLDSIGVLVTNQVSGGSP
jgi:hypothetical protein